MASVATRLPPVFPSSMAGSLFHVSPADVTSTCRDFEVRKNGGSDFPWYGASSSGGLTDGIDVKMVEDVKNIADLGLSGVILAKSFDFRLVDELRRDIVNLNEEINNFRDKLRLQVEGMMKKAETLQGAVPGRKQSQSEAEHRFCKEDIESPPDDKSDTSVWLEGHGKDTSVWLEGHGKDTSVWLEGHGKDTSVWLEGHGKDTSVWLEGHGKDTSVWLEGHGKDGTKVEIVEQQVCKSSGPQKRGPGFPRESSPRTDDSRQSSPDFLTAERHHFQRNFESKQAYEPENVTMKNSVIEKAWVSAQGDEEETSVLRGDSKNLTRLSSSSEDDNLDPTHLKSQRYLGPASESGTCYQNQKNHHPEQLNLMRTFDVIDTEGGATMTQRKNDQGLPSRMLPNEKDDGQIIPPPCGYREPENCSREPEDGSKSAGKKSPSPRSLKLLGEEKRAFLRDCMGKAARILSQKCRQKYKPLENKTDPHPHNSAPTGETVAPGLCPREELNNAGTERFGSTFIYEESISTTSDLHDDCNGMDLDESFVTTDEIKAPVNTIFRDERNLPAEAHPTGTLRNGNSDDGGSLRTESIQRFAGGSSVLQQNHQTIPALTRNGISSRSMRNTHTGSSSEYTQTEAKMKVQYAPTNRTRADPSVQDNSIKTGGEGGVKEPSESRYPRNHIADCHLSASPRQDHGGVSNAEQRPCCMFGYMMSNPSLQPSFLLHPPGFMSLWTQQALTPAEVTGTLVPPVTRFVHVSERMRDLMGLGGKERTTADEEPNLKKQPVLERDITGCASVNPTLSRDSNRKSFRPSRELQTPHTLVEQVTVSEGTSQKDSENGSKFSKGTVKRRSVSFAQSSKDGQNWSDNRRDECNDGFTRSATNPSHNALRQDQSSRANPMAAPVLDCQGANAKTQETQKESGPSLSACMAVPCWETYISALPIVGCPFIAPTYQRMSFLPMGEQLCPVNHGQAQEPSGQSSRNQSKSSKGIAVSRPMQQQPRPPPDTGTLVSNESSEETSRFATKTTRYRQQHEHGKGPSNQRQLPEESSIQKSAELFEEIRKKTSHDDPFPPRRPCLLPRKAHHTDQSAKLTPALQSKAADAPQAIGRSKSLKLAMQLSRAASMAGMGGAVSNVMGHCINSLDPKCFLMNTIVKILNNFEDENSPRAPGSKRLESPFLGKDKDGSRTYPAGSPTWTEMAEKSVERHFVVETLRLALEDGSTPELPLECIASLREEAISGMTSALVPFTHSAHTQPPVHFNTGNLRLVTSEPVFQAAAVTYDRKQSRGRNDQTAGVLRQGPPPAIPEGSGRERWDQIREETEKYMFANSDHIVPFPERSAERSRASYAIAQSQDILTNGDRPLARVPGHDPLTSFRDRSPLCRLSPPRSRSNSRDNQLSPRQEVSPRSRVDESDSLRRTALNNIRRSRGPQKGGYLSRSASTRVHMGTRDVRQSVQHSSCRDHNAARGRFQGEYGETEPEHGAGRGHSSESCRFSDDGHELPKEKEAALQSHAERHEEHNFHQEDAFLRPREINIESFRFNIDGAASNFSVSPLPRSALPESCGPDSYGSTASSAKTAPNMQTESGTPQLEPSTRDVDKGDETRASNSCPSSKSISGGIKSKSKMDSSSKRNRSRSKMGSSSSRSRSRSCFETASCSSDDWDSTSSVSLCFSSSSSNCDLTSVSDLDVASRSCLPVSSGVPLGFSV